MAAEASAGKKASFSHFMKEAEIIVDDKMFLKDMIANFNFSIYNNREKVLSHCRNMLNDEVHMLFSKYRNQRLNEIISAMIQIQKMSATQDVSEVFNEMALKYLKEYSSAQHESKLGLHTSVTQTDTERLFSSFDVPKYLINSFGITISPEMLTFAVACCARAVKKWDNIIMVEAMPGTGKTTFGQALLTTMIDVYRAFYNITVPFGFDKNIIVTETREFCNELIDKSPHYNILDFIEAGNQFSNKKFFDDDQQDLVNTVERIRFHGLTLILEWNTVDGLDKTIRHRRATAVVSIEERGKAIARGFNRNPTNRGLAGNISKNDVILSSQQATELLENDILKIYDIPIFPLPADWEKQVDNRKETAGKVLSKRKVVEAQYIEFLNTIDDNQIRITSEEIQKYNVKHFKTILPRRLALYIAKNIGSVSLRGIFEANDPSSPELGIINITEVIKSYIKHVKAITQGSQTYEKEKSDERNV